jgi:hypothetical protein
MKVYKKNYITKLLKSEEVIYIGHPTDSKFKYQSIEILKLNKWSLMHNMLGLNLIFQGPLAYIAKNRYGIEENKVEIDEVIIGGMRIMPYMKYQKLIQENNVGALMVLNILRI